MMTKKLFGVESSPVELIATQTFAKQLIAVVEMVAANKVKDSSNQLLKQR